AIISCGIPTSTRIVVPEDSPVLCGFMPAQTVLKTTLTGDYKNLKEAWDKTSTYLMQNDYEKSAESPQFEMYIITPAENPNPADWITELYLPIKTVENL
ncbi:MAG: GyrI-like domain-containing protein, partial [Leeuwenhoekiella sp.]